MDDIRNVKLDKTIKGVFFDVYGTLLIYNNMSKAWSDWLSTFYNCLKNCGLEISKESFAKHCNGFLGKPAPPSKDDGLTVFERKIKVHCTELGIDLKKKELSDIAITCINAWEKYLTFDPDTLPVLNALKKDKILAIISNYDHPPHIYDLLSDLGLLKLFDSIIVSGEVGVKKPDPKIFSFALKETRLLAKEVIFIGDAPEDIHGANAAGIYSILIRRKEIGDKTLITDYNLNQQDSHQNKSKSNYGANRIISKLTELISMFQ